MRTITLFLIGLSLSLNSYGQYDHISIYPDLEGADLETALTADYTPSNVLDLRQARDTLYKSIYSENDSVSCVYTGLTKYLDPEADPSEFLFQNGGNENINLEHCYPQGKGASRGNAQADMHHLYPSRVPVNSARGSDPYKEIPDSQTNNWFYNNLTQRNIPSTNKALYSEDNNDGFEPREDFKGNVARAYFYFYTIYRSEADGQDPDYFDLQLSTLCDWHEADPVDSLEWLRNYRIASYQDDKVNPFILDCRLARLYCGNFSTACGLVDTEESSYHNIQVVNNTLSTGEYIYLKGTDVSNHLRSTILTLEGRVVTDTLVSAAGYIPAPLDSGMYLLLIRNSKIPLLTTKIVVR